MLHRWCALLGTLCFALTVQAQDAPRRTLSGYVEDAASGEKLIGATLYDAERGLGTVTNRYGFFSLTLPNEPVTLGVSFIGYESRQLTFTERGDTTFTVQLAPRSFELGDVVVEAERVERVEETTRMGTIDVPVAQIEKVPALLGEVDVLKTLQLLPGVQSGTEGGSGLYVRGGSPDQNLILLDGTPVYNVSHLFGFFSVFNNDAIKNVELTKGGFPARYGGRLSSVIEIGMKEGNMKRFAGQGGIGLIASRLTVEGPIQKDKTSFIVSGRRTYIDLLIRPFLQDETSGGYYFYDFNAKVNHVLSNRDRLYASVYTGDDRFYASYRDTYDNDRYEDRERANFGWGNVTSALRWNHVVSNKLFANTTLTYSRYRFGVNVDSYYREPGPNGGSIETEDRLRYRSGIRDWSARVDFDYLPSPNHYVRTGASATLHRFTPSALQFRADASNVDTTIASDPTDALEAVVYAEDDLRLSDLLKVNVGVHLSAFFVEGTTYASVQPRVSLRYLVGSGVALKASFVTMRQYIHLLTNAGIGLPTDLWVPATERVAPQAAWQGALGAAKSLKDGAYEVSVEGYYKAMRGLITYKEGAGFTAPGADWQDEVYTGGEGTSYGAELFVQKRRGRTTGWLGYTLSWTDRQFDDLNDGEPYPYRFDRRHDVSFVLTRQLSERFDLGLTWVYGTGNALTLPTARYLAAPSTRYGGFSFGQQIEYFDTRNDFRAPAYHRLDVSVQYFFRRGVRESVLALSVYNAYNHRNPFFLDIVDDYNERIQDFERRLVGYTLFPILPSLSYRFSF